MFLRFIVFLFLIPFLGYTQKYVSTPYSSQGFGLVDPLTHPTFGALGNAKTAYIDSSVLNFYNPSSYSFLGQGQPIFSVGISSQFSTFVLGDNTSKSSISAINHFSFGFSFAKRFGFGVGIKPFSSKGYSLIDSLINNSDTLIRSFTGFGNITDAFAGLSFKLINSSKYSLSLGANVSYLFGSILDEQRTHLSGSTSGGVYSNMFKAKSFLPVYALTFQSNLNRANSLLLSGVYNFSSSLNGNFSSSNSFSTDINNSTIQDTINFTSSSSTFNIPSSFSFGFKFDHTAINSLKRTENKIYHLLLTGEVKYTDWSKFQNNTGITVSYKNTLSYSFGIEYSPHYDFLDRSKSIGFFNKIKYRSGYQCFNLPYSYKESQVVSSGITFGIGIPIVSQRSLSSINMNYVYGKRQDMSNLSFTENFSAFNLGVMITPAIYDRWFRKGKID
jgi:hypothetical protein